MANIKRSIWAVSLASNLGFALTMLLAGCGGGPSDSAATSGCQGGKCDDPGAVDEPCAGLSAEALGCCWIEPASEGDTASDMLVCSHSTRPDAGTPAASDGSDSGEGADSGDVDTGTTTSDDGTTGGDEPEPDESLLRVSIRVDQLEPQGKFLQRTVLEDSSQPQTAWAIEHYPFELSTEVVIFGDDVVGLGSGIASTRTLRVESAQDVSPAAPWALESPVDVWEIDVYNAYLDELVRFEFLYELLGDMGVIPVDELAFVTAFGTLETIAVAVPRGETALPLSTVLLSPENTSEGERRDIELTGSGPYRLDADGGFRRLGPEDLAEPAGTSVAGCRVEQTVTPADPECVPMECPDQDADCEPVSCGPTTLDELVCSASLPAGVGLTVATVRAAAPEGMETPEAVVRTLEMNELRIPLDPSTYPVVVEIETTVDDSVVGLQALDDRVHRTAMTFEAPGATTPEARLPFELWEVTLSAAAGTTAFVFLDPWTVELGFEWGDRFALRATGETVFAFETAATTIVAAPVGLESLTGTAELHPTVFGPDVVSVDVEVRPGAWTVTPTGTEPL